MDASIAPLSRIGHCAQLVRRGYSISTVLLRAMRASRISVNCGIQADSIETPSPLDYKYVGHLWILLLEPIQPLYPRTTSTVRARQLSRDLDSHDAIVGSWPLIQN
jgi:hypothetical protein